MIAVSIDFDVNNTIDDLHSQIKLYESEIYEKCSSIKQCNGVYF